MRWLGWSACATVVDSFDETLGCEQLFPVGSHDHIAVVCTVMGNGISLYLTFTSTQTSKISLLDVRANWWDA